VIKKKTRLTKELEEAQKYLTTLNKKLSNNEFVKNAPEAVVNVEKEKMRLQQEKVEKLKAQLASL
jgi:valyl-tRNA synthetase